MKHGIVSIWFGLLSLVTFGQTHSEKINREFAFEEKSLANALVVANINGNIKVEGYDGDKVIVQATRTIKAKNESRLEKGKKEIQLGVIDRADSIILFVQGSCNAFGRINERSQPRGEFEIHWGYTWNNRSPACDEAYDYTMDFVIRVPRSVHLSLSTINEGNIAVVGVTGIVNASNINGGIALKNLEREANATTINGDVDIEFARNPQQDCRFYSLNGDINTSFQKGLAANLSFESFNGELYTNVDRIESLPVKVEKLKEGDGIKFKVNGNRYKVGAGGVLLNFETFNGNVYLKEK